MTRQRTITSIALAALLLGAAWLRFTGIDRLLPHAREPDAFVAYELQDMRGDPTRVDGQNHRDRYPQLIARTLALLPRPPFDAHARSAAANADPGANVAAAAREYRLAELEAASRAFLDVRLLSAVASVLQVLATFVLVRRFIGPTAGLIASFFVATSLLSILFAQQARPHACQATLALLSVLLALRAHARPSWARVLAATALAALAIASLQTGVFVLTPLALALFLSPSERSRRITFAIVLPLFALALAALFYTNPPYIDADGFHLARERGGGHTVSFQDLNLRGALRSARDLWWHDPILAVFAGIGGAFALGKLRRHFGRVDRATRHELAIVLAYVVPYAGVLAIDGEVYERFLLPLLPYLACLAAYAVVMLLRASKEHLRKPAERTLAYTLVIASASAFPAWTAWHFNRVAVAPDTYEQAADWIRAEVDPTSNMLVLALAEPPLFNDAASLQVDAQDVSGSTLPWIMHQALLPPLPAWVPRFAMYLAPARFSYRKDFDEEQAHEFIDRMQPRYILFELSQRMLDAAPVRWLYLAALARGTVVFRSQGQAPDALANRLVQYQNIDRLAVRILSTRAFGPEIVVVRIER